MSVTRLVPISLLLSALLPLPLAGAVGIEPVAESLASPVFATHAGDDRVFLVEAGGRVRILRDGEIVDRPFLQADVGRLWSIAFPPDFPETPWIFAHAREAETGHSLLLRYSLSPTDPDRAEEASRLELLRIPKQIHLHYGGQLAFGPDGMLYVSTGDGTDGDVGPDPLCLSQTLDSLEGKILRLDVDVADDAPPGWSVPPDNPFLDSPSPEVWSLGLRNPWRFSFDRETGDLWLSDVGENRREEVNWRPDGGPGGENYGWKIMEGTFCATNLSGCPVSPSCNDPSLVLPTIEYAHQEGRCSIIGGFVYRGGAIPELYGRYLYGDFCSGEIWAARREGDAWIPELLDVSIPGLVSFGEDSLGELLLLAGSSVHRLVDPDGPTAGTVGFAARALRVDETRGVAVIELLRAGGDEGEVAVEVAAGAGTARPGTDFGPIPGPVSWADGEAGLRTVEIPILDDSVQEPTESIVLELLPPSGGARIGARSSFELSIEDDDPCTPSAEVLCLNRGRFRVGATWESPTASGVARAEPVTGDSGFFWFFGEENPEIFVKVLDACTPPFDRYWVFLAGLTDVATRIEVVDGSTGESRVYSTELGEGFEAIRDTDAFATCP